MSRGNFRLISVFLGGLIWQAGLAKKRIETKIQENGRVAQQKKENKTLLLNNVDVIQVRQAL